MSVKLLTTDNEWQLRLPLIVMALIGRPSSASARGSGSGSGVSAKMTKPD